MFKASVAEREKLKLMVGLTGPSGAGKTLSALKMAHGITGDWKRIAVADTENSSALYYAGDKTGPWQHIPFDGQKMKGGYSPENWVKLIEYAETLPIDALVLDSITHEWSGVGGSLELVDSLSQGKSAFSNGWKKVTPLHRAFIDRMRHSRLHILATMRSKQDYVVETGTGGKATPRKVGLKSEQRDQTDFEFGIIFDIDISHFASASKDRTGLFMDRTPFKIDEDTGKELSSWANMGKESKTGFDSSNDNHRTYLIKLLKANDIPEKDFDGFFKRMDGKPSETITDILEEYRSVK
jgi:hypothetical protein